MVSLVLNMLVAEVAAKMLWAKWLKLVVEHRLPMVAMAVLAERLPLLEILQHTLVAVAVEQEQVMVLLNWLV
jgi:hypothetical protein